MQFKFPKKDLDLWKAEVKIRLSPQAFESRSQEILLMETLHEPHREKWDPFQLQVQKSLVEPLGLDTIVIRVHRHQGTNGSVRLTFPPYEEDHSSKDDDQLTVPQLRKKIKAVLDSLLKNCRVEYGRIKIEVHQGQLSRTQFSFSAKPHESTTEFFVV